jgi:hypothetical protein
MVAMEEGRDMAEESSMTDQGAKDSAVVVEADAEVAAETGKSVEEEGNGLIMEQAAAVVVAM